MKYLFISGLLFCLIMPAVSPPQTATQETIASPPAKMSNTEDHRRTLDLLGIKELRPGANGSDKNAPNYANYDESKATPYRRNWGERLENIADPYAYHWVSGNYMKYSANPLSANDLPVDTHMLVALCAPLITFLSGSTLEAGDGWVDTKGTFMAGAAASPVFRLLGAKDMGTTEFPPVGTRLADGRLAFRQHTDGHTAGSNWAFFIDLCERYGFRTNNTR